MALRLNSAAMAAKLLAEYTWRLDRAPKLLHCGSCSPVCTCLQVLQRKLSQSTALWQRLASSFPYNPTPTDEDDDSNSSDIW